MRDRIQAAAGTLASSSHEMTRSLDERKRKIQATLQAELAQIEVRRAKKLKAVSTRVEKDRQLMLDLTNQINAA